MINLKRLSSREQESQLEFPAYISLLAANTDRSFDYVKELSAVEFNHVKTGPGYQSPSERMFIRAGNLT